MCAGAEPRQLAIECPAIEAIDAHPAQKAVEFFDAITIIAIVNLIAIMSLTSS
ncbi:MAG: hypothetical protein JOY61_11650 [Chloroflexi bacterium]|nr:hypothetical protein [Chloroflexota bacterium]